MERFEKLINLIGEDRFEKLQKSNVIVFGVGGVGGYVVEGLARCGVGHITVVDFDIVDISNINRQIIALDSTIGKYKVDVIKDRVKDINPNCEVKSICKKIDKENIYDIDLSAFDFVVDAIDTVTSKIVIIKQAREKNVDVISCMGTGNKLDVTKLQITEIEKTSMCPLSRVMRKLLKEEKIEKVKVLFSTEKPQAKVIEHRPQSAIFVPATGGLMIADYVVMKLMEKK